jgi:hypothetical protein
MWLPPPESLHHRASPRSVAAADPSLDLEKQDTACRPEAPAESMADSLMFAVFMVFVLVYSCLYLLYWSPAEFYKR